MTENSTFKLPDSSLPIASLERSLSGQSLTNSYKLYWFLGLLDIVQEFPGESSLNISFSDVVIRMVSLSWYTLLEYKLNFGAMDKLGRVVKKVSDKYELSGKIPPAEVRDLVGKIEDPEIIELLRDFERYVPYRFLTPFLKGLSGIPDHLKNKAIVDISRNDPKSPYMILDNNRLIINSEWLGYFYSNNVILKGWARMKLTDFLQIRNPNVPAIHQKLEPPVERKLTAARKYWKEFLVQNPMNDIFKNTALDVNQLSIDHFIPWSFVLHDKLWNLVPTMKSINSSKGNQLPPFDRFFRNFSDTQYSALKWHLDKNPGNKLLEDYLIMNPDILKKDLTPGSFRNILENNLEPVWNIAHNQGFGVWEF